MFPKGNLVITGGHFVQNHHVAPNHEFQTLCRHISVGALLDARERFNPPRCHPETRRALLSTVLSWITQVNRSSFVLWLRGSVGSGKSALAQSVAERCRDLNLPTATFFFSRLFDQRRYEKFLCPTLSYQIAQSKPATRNHIEGSIRVDPSIFGLSFQTQFRKLIVDPLILAQNENGFDETTTPQLVILDGLDECHDPKAQGYILDVITQEFDRCANLPLLFLITSRPEEHICFKFGSGMLKRITLELSLEDYFGAHDDIRIFINSGFDEIKQSHPLRHHLPSTWPSQEVIEELVQKSSRQFVYASIVVEYVSSMQHRPTERLDVIRGLSPHDGDSPFTMLDALIKHVFSLAVHRKHALRILSAILLMDLEMSHEVIEKLLSLKPGDARIYLSGLASLIDFQDHRKKITVLHPSLRDFLLDSNRSEGLCINDRVAHANIAVACLRQLEILEEPILIDYACYNIETHLDFACGTAELHEALLNFDLGRFHDSARDSFLQRNVTDSNSQITLEDIWYFVPIFFDCIRNTVIFNDWENLYDHHTEIFDHYISQELDKYAGDSRLTDLVTMLTVCHSPITVKNLDNVPHLNDDILEFNISTEHLVLIDQSALNLRYMVRRHGQSEAYIELLSQFLEDPSRSGRHFIDGEKYALAALRCSRQIAKLFLHSKDEHNIQVFIWSLECIPPLLLYAAFHQELVSFLELAYLETIPRHDQYSFYPILVRQVKEAWVAYLIFHSFEARGGNLNGTCKGHVSQLCLIPQGLKIILNSSRRTLPKFDELLVFPPSASALFCCCPSLLAEYFVHANVTDMHLPYNFLGFRDQSSIIIRVENPFSEISEQSILEISNGPDLTPTPAGVMKALTYRIWRDLVQNSGD